MRIQIVHHNLLKNHGKKIKIGHWPVSFQGILIKKGFSIDRRQGQTGSVKRINLQ